jgi:hypothetical protein
MPEPMVVEFEGSVKSVKEERGLWVQFVRLDGFLDGDTENNMLMRRFKVVMTEIKDW